MEIATYMLQNMQIKEGIVEAEKYKFLFSVETVNNLVLDGVPFRDAYKIVGKDIDSGNFQPDTKVKHTHEGSLGNLCNEEIQAKMKQVWKGFKFSKSEKAIKKLVG